MWPIRPIGPKYRICVIHWHTIELVHDTKNNNTITCAHSKDIDQIEHQHSQRIVFEVHPMVAKVFWGFRADNEDSYQIGLDRLILFIHYVNRPNCCLNHHWFIFVSSIGPDKHIFEHTKVVDKVVNVFS